MPTICIKTPKTDQQRSRAPPPPPPPPPPPHHTHTHTHTRTNQSSGLKERLAARITGKKQPIASFGSGDTSYQNHRRINEQNWCPQGERYYITESKEGSLKVPA